MAHHSIFFEMGNTDSKYNGGFFNTFVIKSTNMYFGYKDKVYVINK
jgi:hypothetical protein